MNGLTLLIVLAMVVGIAVAWRAGVLHGRRDRGRAVPATPAVTQPGLREENEALRSALADAEAMRYHAAEFGEDRRRLLHDLAAARAETGSARES